MIIKEAKKTKGRSRLKKYLFTRKKSFTFLIASIFFISCSSLLLYSGARIGARAYKLGLHTVAKEQVLEYLKLPLYCIKGHVANSERISINIKHENYQKLAYIREILLGKVFGAEKPYVSAEINYKDECIPVGIRLKGDRMIHFKDESQLSFRIKTKGENTLFGMKKFSLHKPRARNYIYEWLFHQVLKREGLIHLRYKFIDVTINGKDVGVYALEEHFEKRLIENNQLREGPIIRFKEGFGDFWQSPIVPFSSDEDSVSACSELTAKAINLLESWREGKLRTSQVFDIKKLAKFFAITDLLSTSHGALWKSMRFYYNPITSRLEPVGFDGHYGASHPYTIAAENGVRPDSGGLYSLYGDFFRQMFNNKETFDYIFFEEYIKALEQLSKPSYLDELFKDINDELDRNISLIYRDFPVFADYLNSFGPDFFTFSKKLIYKKQDFIRASLEAKRGMHAYYKNSTKNSIIFELGNINSLPLEVLNVSYKDTFFTSDKRIILPAKRPDAMVDYQNVKFNLPDGFVWSDTMILDTKVDYKVVGTASAYSTTIYGWSHLEDSFINNDFLRKPFNAGDFDFLVVDEKTKKIFFKKGLWELRESLIIPKGYEVIASKGIKLCLYDLACIVSYSPIRFVGSKDSPITVCSPDSTGQGIVIMNAEQKSILDYVIFKNLSNPSKNGWELSGAVTFYESPVEVSNCQVLNNRSEDALNIVRSDFLIDNSLFSKTFSDAVDVDFGSGNITNSSFVECGNDAVDTSGSIVSLQNISINGAGDKGFSSGENSEMTINMVEINNALIAAAAKDMSKLSIHNVTISGCKIGFAVYQKKPEFGPASTIATKSKMDNVSIPYLVEKGSELIIEGEKIKSYSNNVQQIIYN